MVAINGPARGILAVFSCPTQDGPSTPSSLAADERRRRRHSSKSLVQERDETRSVLFAAADISSRCTRCVNGGWRHPQQGEERHRTGLISARHRRRRPRLVEGHTGGPLDRLELELTVLDLHASGMVVDC